MQRAPQNRNTLTQSFKRLLPVIILGCFRKIMGKRGILHLAPDLVCDPITSVTSARAAPGNPNTSPLSAAASTSPQHHLWETYSAQSTATMSVMSAVGSPTDVSTMTIVTSPDWGIPAAPMLAAVAVMLQREEGCRIGATKKAAFFFFSLKE